MGLDARIGPAFLKAGIGYGGSCFPKDVDAFAHLAQQVGYDFELLEAVRAINDGQRELVLTQARVGAVAPRRKTITLLGAAFKPGTDDLREAPAIHLARQLLAEGATVRIYDPVALDAVAEGAAGGRAVRRPDGGVPRCARGGHRDRVGRDPQARAAELFDALDYPIVIDGRNVFDPDEFIDVGLRYHSIGRRSVGTALVASSRSVSASRCSSTPTARSSSCSR
jgi:UDPglucose 6-dehydrogenase